jgi:hypothetical protein
MKALAVALFCFSGSPLFSQVEARKQADKTLPAGIDYQGVVSDAVVVSDKNGASIIVITETAVQPSKTWPDSKEKEMFVYRYITQSEGPRLLWKVYDFVKECPLDTDATFLGGAEAKGITVTDLDNDNDAEVWMAYRLICRGDVSPGEVKIIMYEGKTRHAMRGKSKVKVSPTDYDGGSFTIDQDLEKAPQVFKDYAKQLWEKIVVE